MKSFAKRGVLLSLGIVVAMSMAGCPTKPVLNASPTSVTLSTTRTDAQITIANNGSGTLQWTAQVTVPWLELSVDSQEQRSQTVSSTTRETSMLRVFVITDQLPDLVEQVRTNLVITSNGGSQDVAIAMERLRTPLVSLEPSSLDFSDFENEMFFEVLNVGDAVLQWSIEVPEDLDWMTVEPAAGSVLRGGAQGVTVSINRALLLPQTEPYEIPLAFFSNGGDTTLDVTILAPAFTVTPRALEFGLTGQPETRLLTLATQSSDLVNLTMTTSAGSSWMQIDATVANVTNATPYDLRVTVNPIGMTPGDYTASINITHAASAWTRTIPVSMTVGTPASFRIDPAVLDLGQSRDIVQGNFTLINEGESAIDFRIEKPQNVNWIDLSVVEGVLDSTVPVTVTANPTNLSPGVYNVPITVFAGGVSRTMRITLSRPADPIVDGLQVEPRELDFGTLLNRLDINIWNEGPSQIDWSIDSGSLPAWLQISPLSGQVGGAFTQVVRVNIERDFVPEDQNESVYTFTVNSSAPGDEPIDVRVTVRPQQFPKIEIVGEGTDANNVPFVVINIGEDSDVFVIRNIGRADLDWRVDTANLPAWITAISPQQGQLRPNREQQVSVTTDRTGLDQSGASHRLFVRSNDPDMPAAPVDISVRVPFSIIIGVRPDKLVFGRTLSTLPFEVANLGDAGWPLDFVITSNHPDWIYVEPSRGRSIGTNSPVKDWQFISVAIDRGRIREGAVAKLLIQAENVPPTALPVEPVEVDITFDIAELTIESAIPRLRPPSLLRFNLLLRDAAQRIFPGYEDDFGDARTLYGLTTLQAQILEDSVPLELSETNVFVKKDEELSFAVMLLLDYSASMEQVAIELVEDGQLVPGGRAPLDALYIQTIGAMMQEFPSHYKVGLAVFNERRPWWHSSIRVITGAPNPADPRATESFVSDKAILQYRIENTDVLEYGATPLFQAIYEAGLTMYYLDNTLPEFDSTAEKILVAVTDGRVTTPPGDLNEVETLFEGLRIRFFPIGFGKTVQANPLIQLSASSGGHFYATNNVVVPGSFDQNGEPVSIPVLSSLLDWCRTNPDPAVENPQSLPRDLRSHVVVAYTTLNEESGMEVQARLEVEEVDPSVQETVIYDSVPSIIIANDTKLGQIGMNTDGIQPDGSVVVSLYADYVPRNIRRLQLEITTVPALAWTAALVAADQGGLLHDWNMVQAGNILTLTSTTDRPLAYGDYGKLVNITLAGVAAPFRMNLSVLEPVSDGSPDGKYFTVPRGMDIGYEPFRATSFPNPEFEFTPTFNAIGSNVIEANTADPPVTLLVKNVGGEHLPTLAGLYWRVVPGNGYLSNTIPIKADFDYDGIEPVGDDYYLVYPELNGLAMGIADIGEFVPDVPVDEFDVPIPGVYSYEFYIDVYYGSLYLYFNYGPYYLKYTVN